MWKFTVIFLQHFEGFQLFKNKKFNEETIGIAAPIPGASCLLEAKQLTLSHASHPNTQNQLSEAPIIARWQSQD